MGGVWRFLVAKSSEMKSIRKMLKISWIKRVTNEVVLNEMKEKQRPWKSIQFGRDNMMGHI